MAFSTERFTRSSQRVRWEDLDLTVFRTDPLPGASLRTLRYMADVEYHTVCYLRDMLVTPSHEDGDVGSFMTMWNREEFWHGEALADVLRHHGIVLGWDHLKAKRLTLGWRDKVGPIKQSLLANLIGPDFVAVHMVWGAVNEWTTHTAYQRLMALEPHPVLVELLGRIARQESRHVAFYATQARERLGRSARARTVARVALERLWRPVGSGVMPDAEIEHVMGHLFSAPEGRAAASRVDDHVAGMPGMSGLTILQDALDDQEVPAA